MKHLYHIFMVLFLEAVSLQQPFAAAAAEAVESPDAGTLPAACHQIIDEIQTVLISRRECITYLTACMDH